MTTAGACIVPMFSPLVESDTNTAVLRGVLGDPLATGDFEGSHGISTGIKINLMEAGWVKSGMGLDGVGGGPVLESVWVFQEGVQELVMGRGEFVVTVPDGPTLMGDGQSGGHGVEVFRYQNIPVQFGKVVHFFIEDFSPGKDMFLAFLVPSDMLGV